MCEFLSLPAFIPFRYLQAIILYPLSQAAHIKFFSSFLINQSLNPSKSFNRTRCSSLNSVQFPQASDNVLTWGVRGEAGSKAPAADSPNSLTPRSTMPAHAHTCTRTHTGSRRAHGQHGLQPRRPFCKSDITTWGGCLCRPKVLSSTSVFKGKIKSPCGKFYSPVRFSLAIPTHSLTIRIMPL